MSDNIIKSYGRDKFLFLINEFSKGTSGAEIARQFSVTRQRVNQWKKALGVESVTFTMFAGVEDRVRGKSSSGTISGSRTII
ncbi:MAG: hypothetical protein L3J47_00580 [Sulfurovum sp.]|nr:hypothetical protein [Sulfurovum sp.]